MGHWWPLILSSPDPALPPGLWWWAQWRSTSRRGCQRPTAWLPCRDSNCSSLSAPGMARQHPTWWQRCSGLHLLLSRGWNMVKPRLFLRIGADLWVTFQPLSPETDVQGVETSAISDSLGTTDHGVLSAYTILLVPIYWGSYASTWLVVQVQTSTIL
jgi:hypothetical protein